MGLLDRPRLRALADFAEEHLGVGIRPVEELERAQVLEREFVDFVDEIEAATRWVDLSSEPTPKEMAPERRRSIAQKARVAFTFDPLAGAEASLLGDFAFGRGVQLPTARDPKVQEVIDRAWTDANNEEKLTGYMAQRRLSNELLTSGELFLTLYESGGRVRVGRLDPDLVEAIVTDPHDRNRPLWYVVREREFRWDFETDSPRFGDVVDGNGRQKVRYWKHWRNYDDAVAERESGAYDDGGNRETVRQSIADITPPPEKQAEGVVFHVAINQLGEQSRGTPPWARSLRFFSAMNRLTESHVAMAEAASTFIARQHVAGNRRTVTSSIASILGRASEIAASRTPQPASDRMTAFAPGGHRPPAPGSFWVGNENARIEALTLQSGAGQMHTTAQIVRAPIAAAAGFGQHYLGDASTTNLATASTLELPATMRIESWQELFAQIYRWFTDRAIEAALKAGELGEPSALDDDQDPRSMSELRLHESDARATLARRVRRDLTYSFSMPFPGRRQLPDVQNFVTGIVNTFDPDGQNIPLRRAMLRFALEPTGEPDIARLIEEALPESGVPGVVDPESDATATLPPEGGALPPDTPPGTTPPERETVPRVRRQASDPESAVESVWVPPELRPAVDEFERADAERFRALVTEPALAALVRLGASSEPETAGAGE